MRISGKNNINVSETVKNAVNGSDDFHFFVDELSADNYMPTYAGMADEKYGFDEMDDAFFEFLERKIGENGIYIRLIHATGQTTDDGAEFTLECAGETKTFTTEDDSNVLVFEFADFGIKVTGDEIILGTTVEGGCGHTPYFAEFGSDRGNAQYLSLDNPLNIFAADLIWEMIVLDE